MESDLPLMELAEADDSLIQPFPDPNQTPSKSSFNYFTCSPLAFPPSRTKSLKDSVHTEKPSSSSSEASNNKENINSNNVEMPKLGMGPIQMKRRKKGAEHNLRKSLAWDRAFFTDEGILDPRELNLITGINAYTCGRGLSSISEEGNSSFPLGSRSRNEPNDMEASKEALLKELRDKSRTPKGNRVGDLDSLPHHKVTHKVLSSDHSNRARSKVAGCSEPSPASSLKRPNSSILRTAKKEFKLPKLPMSKPGSCSSATTKGSITASQSRHNLIPKPPTNVQKNVGLKSSLKDVHGSQSKAKTGPDSLCLPLKEPAQKAVRDLTHSSSKSTSSTKPHLVQVDKANSGLEMVSDRLQSCEIQDESTPFAAKSLAQLTQTTLNNSLPSGLRLPSPSLRFFDQTTSESVSLQQKRHKQSNTHSTPCGSSPSSNYIGNTTKRVTDSNIYPDIVRKIMLRADIESHEFVEQEKRILGHKGKIGMEKIALKDDEEIKVSHPTEQYEEGIGVSIHNKEEKLQNYTTSVSTSGESIQHQEHNILTMNDGSMNFMQDLAQTSSEQADTEKSDAPKVVKIESLLDAGSLEAEDLVSEVFVESHRGGIGKREDDVDCIMPAESSSLKEGPCANVTRINDYLTQKGQSICDECDLENSNEKLLTSKHRIEAEVSKISFGEQVEAQVHHEIDEKSKDATVLMKRSINIKRQDKSLVIHLPNAVPFSDERLATIEASGEDLAQTSREQADTKKSSDCKVNSESFEVFVESQRDETGKREDDVGATTPCISEGHSGKCIMPAESSRLHEAPCGIATEMNDYTFQEKNGSQNAQGCTDELETSTHRIGAEESKISFGEEVKAQVLVEGKNNDAAVLMKRSYNIKRQDKSLVIHAVPVPFSDEWLAAIEAAGEEILTMKCGAVQHSPPDKSIPERNPWSPVKNKANQIGPYDCTKYTNAMPSNPHLSD